MPMWIVWAALVGGVAFQIWYSLAWMALPHHHGDFKSLGKTSPIQAALDATKPAGGLYMIPHYGDYVAGMKDPEFQARFKTGSKAWIVVMGGACDMGAKVFATAFVLNVLESFALALLVHWTSWVHCMPCVVAFAAGVGLLARVGAYFSQAIWMQLPWRYALTNVFDGVVGFALVGVVIHLFRP